MVTGVVSAKESPMIKSAYGSFKRVLEIKVMAYFLIMCTLYWFYEVLIYGFVASSRCGFYCGFNASLGNASMLSDVSFDRPLTVYTAGLVTVWGIVYYIKWISSIHQCRGDVDGDVWLVFLSKRVHWSHQLPPQALWSSLRVVTITRTWRVSCSDVSLGVSLHI